MTLNEDILGAKFGTKNRAELILRTEKIKEAVKDILWMARRYANGRKTYAPSLFNDAYDILRTEFGDEVDRKGFTHTGSNETYYDITIEHTKDHPYACYDDHTEPDDNGIFGKRKYVK